MNTGILWHAKGTVVAATKFRQKTAGFATIFEGAFFKACPFIMMYLF